MRIDISTILFEEIEKTRLQVIANMQANKQVVTGRTAASLHTVTSENSGILYGAEHISTLETGISPFQSKQKPFYFTFYKLKSWYHNKGITNNASDDPRIGMATINQREIGSLLFRKTGGKANGLVYGKEVNPLVTNIKNRIAGAIIDTKILQ